jgi:hypothetical protein
VRRGAWVIPNFLLGRPLDQVDKAPAWAPMWLRRLFMAPAYRLIVGDMERYGLPRPDHRLGEAHPTISSELLPKLGRGEIAVKPAIAELQRDSVRFTDGSVERVDAVVWCTGYKVTFPFLDEDFVSASDNDLPLFRRVFLPGVPDLFFVGLLQPLGAIMPIAEAQGRWIAEYLTGRYALPAEAAMRADIDRHRRRMHGRYVASRRHTMQVDYDHYLWSLRREVRRGRRRARRSGRGAAP